MEHQLVILFIKNFWRQNERHNRVLSWNAKGMMTELTAYLIAGYVTHVAMHFETAPNTKAEKAESASGDDSILDLLLSCRSSSLRFNWSKTVYCKT